MNRATALRRSGMEAPSQESQRGELIPSRRRPFPQASCYQADSGHLLTSDLPMNQPLLNEILAYRDSPS